MTTEHIPTDYKAELDELFSFYEDGADVFKKADDWTYNVRLKKDKPGASQVPDNWLGLADKAISIIAHGKYGLDTYPNNIEIIDSRQMMDAYASVGMPISYDHWSFGKARSQMDNAYHQGFMGLAYEIVINTNPCIAYCMAQNTKMMQMLVIAHASYGHNSFFKGNHLFKQFTKADEIIDDLLRLKELIRKAEEKHGIREVEKLIDACHALQSHGVNRYTKPVKRTPEQEAERRRRIEEARQLSVDLVMDKTTTKKQIAGPFKAANDETGHIPPDMEENLLRYIASDAPHLQKWQREIIREMSDKAQYFYPQRQTQVMNEGWASFWHYTLLNDMHEMGLISDGMAIEFLESHSGVLYQPTYDNKRYNGINPYSLGFAIYNDIKRMCQNPTDEDREWFPHLAGKKDWLGELKYAMENFKDESFIQQYLSPKVIRDFKLFAYEDDEFEDEIEVKAIHEEQGYRTVRDFLASQYRLGDQEPRIEVVGYNFRGDRTLTLQHTVYNHKPLEEKDISEVLKYIHQLWAHPVVLQSVDTDGDVIETFSCPPDHAENDHANQLSLGFNMGN